ncbi:MAG: alpha/beta fold hydrolase, partial [Actinobacteria bacterium]|nr:alpha/beta fold hydrolase [Actinomycetota bacterium]
MGLGHTITLADGRVLGFDDVGDPHGAAVLYVHGSPDSRRARHPDDDVAARLGIRLVAVDRPGAGLSTAHPTGTVGSFADDVVALADHLGVPAWRPLAWSAGSVHALAVAARHPDRVARVAVVAGLV